MRLVTWEDEKGFMRQSYVPDNAPDSRASSGIAHNPPDLSEMDWGEVERELNNALIAQGLITWQDVQRQRMKQYRPRSHQQKRLRQRPSLR